MKQTITLSAPRSSALPQLRNVVSKITARVFSEQVSIAISSAGAASSFFMAVADHPRACAAIVAVILPWFIAGLKSMEGGCHARV